jgi:FHS family glucose/mannose:H+ symporter-like MFS transporter
MNGSHCEVQRGLTRRKHKIITTLQRCHRGGRFSIFVQLRVSLIPFDARTQLMHWSHEVRKVKPMTERAISGQQSVRIAPRWLLTAGAFFTFFVFGYVDNLKGPVLPTLLTDLNFSYTRGGTLLLGSYLGFMIATLTMGFLADRLGNRLILLTAGLLLTGGLLIFSVGGSFAILFIGMTIGGLGLGAIEVGGNAMIVELYHAQRGRFLNLLAVFHGIGSLSAPLVAAQLLLNDFSWRQVYQVTLGLTAAIALFFLFVRYPRQQQTGGGVSFAAMRSTGFSKSMLLYYLLITTYVAAELGIAAWIVEFLQQVKGMSLGRSSLYLSLFFGFIMLGRLLGSFIVERMGYLSILILVTISSIVTLTLGIFGPPSLAIFIPVTGFFFSIVFPTATAAVSEQHRINTGAILGLLFAFGGLGGALGPWLMGVANDLVGVALGFALTIVYCLVTLLAMLALRSVQPHAV